MKIGAILAAMSIVDIVLLIVFIIAVYKLTKALNKGLNIFGQ